MDAATATLALLVVARGPVDARGNGPAVAIAAAPPGTLVPVTQVDGCVATPRGPSRRANVAWGLAFDPAFTNKERFRDARQLALYFVSHVQDGDAMSVVVTSGSGPRASGVHGLAALTALRAPIDATLDPEKRSPGADAGDLLAFARALSREPAAAPGDALLHVAVALEESGDHQATLVRVVGETLDLRETVAEGTSQSRGPRLVADVAARLATVSRVELDLACADAGTCADAGDTSASARARAAAWPRLPFSARAIALVAALALVLLAAVRVVRRRRGG